MNTVITISRQCGSGGREIGRLLADRLGIPFYDKQGLKEYALESGLDKMLLEAFGDKHASSLLFSLATSAFSFGYFDPDGESPLSQKAYLIAFETIKAVARKSPCVVVGRCGDYVLRDTANCISLFVHAPLEYRVATVADRHALSAKQAGEEVARTDRMRRSYYNYYTTKTWGEADGYSLTLDSGRLGTQGSVELLYQAVCAMEEGVRPQFIPQVHRAETAL